MSRLKTLWASVQDNPILFTKINGWLTVLWLVAIPVCFALGWLTSVVFVSALSLYAIVTGHLAAYQAGRVEVKQDEQEDAR